MKKLTYYLLSTLILSLFAQNAMASHAMGGEITYQHLGGSQYRLTLNFYRDCSGISAPTSVTLALTSNSTSYTVPLPLASTSQISSGCQGLTVCDGGVIPGFEQYVYQNIVTLPYAENFDVSYTLCCRNSAVSNLTNPDSYDYYLTTNIDNTNPSVGNNSPYFSYMPTFILYSGQPALLHFGTVDVDGDSISYEMVEPLEAAGSPIPYAGGYSLYSPLNMSTPLVFDPNTGTMQFTPNGVQNAVLSVLVKEHRFGQVIATTRRDLQFIIVNATNQLSNYSFGNTSPINNAFSVCPGDTLDFSIYFSDPDAGQTINVTASPSLHATVNSNNTTQPSIDYFWAPSITDVSAQPYILTIESEDSGCPPTTTSNTYQIFVSSCYSDVWPGDANSDFVANHFDVLSIGRAWHHSGTPRVAGTINWVAQPASDWGYTFPSGNNYKHADCDGDGTVDSLDLDAIYYNFGRTHLKDMPQKMNGVPLIVGTPTDTFTHGTTVNFPISLGNNTHPANYVYGVAFTIDYDENMFDPSSLNINFDNNWLSNGNNEAISFFHHDEVNGSIDIAIARTDQNNLSGSGEICNISLTLDESLPFVFVSTSVTVRGSVLEDFAENSLIVGEVDAEVISTAPEDTSTNTGINEIALQLGVYPNPANSSITVNTNVQLNDLSIYNLAGQKLQSFQAPYIPQQIDIENLENGVYLISGETTNGKRTYTRFVKMGSGR